MAENEDDQPQIPAVGSLAIQAENIAFDPDDMIACSACHRINPPNRLNCLYCGRELEVEPERLEIVKPNFRRLENWETGFNIILTSPVDPDGPEIASIARCVGSDPSHIREVAAAARPMPVARVESDKGSQIIVDALAKKGVKSMIVGDNALMPDRPPVRLRAIDVNADSLVLVEFNTGNRKEITREDLALIVTGFITEASIDRLEKKRRRGNSKVLDEFETSTDEAVMDIYDRHDPVGYRVMLTGFDFSCLGGDKGMIATENMQRLIQLLHRFAPDAKLVTDYPTVRRVLFDVWEIDSRTDSKGIQRSGFAKFEFGNTISSSNRRQLNRFSRLQWHLL